ncbi:transmembrane anterior posterior transformation protein 1 homolog isoform X2 [Amphiura filiformis]|uniref:transmembrane anterior posterior transformation protein 1 homolog isoform X2 n=1 Tax=Amphiura filiformis TaxID=82378 RepID=UPI003B212F09
MADANEDTDVQDDEPKSPNFQPEEDAQAESSGTEANASSIDQEDRSYSPENVGAQSESMSEGDSSRTENVPSQQMSDVDEGLDELEVEDQTQQQASQQHEQQQGSADRKSRHVDPPPHIQRENQGLSLWKYMNSEVTRGYLLEQDGASYAQKTQRIHTFIRIPKELEKMMIYGFFLCMDAFLFVFTFLPLRVILACWDILTSPCSFRRSQQRLEPAQVCDILKFVLIIVCCWLLQYVDISMLYHIVRGQAVIKLYIIYNMLEVADRLFSSFGQDILDALFWTATEPRRKKREHLGIVPHLFLAICYVFFHCILVMLQATTMNVAVNSHSNTVFTVMLSTNFVELKGSVFKKFDKYNLYQMSCSDVRERYHNVVLLFFVLLRNMAQFSWNLDHFWELVPDVVLVLCAEVLVDWVKHCFITKFNSVTEEVYTEYRANLAYDMVISRKKNAFSDHSDIVSRRMGFIPLPLACLVYRIVSQSVNLHGVAGVVLVILVYICLTAIKVLNSIVLLGKGMKYAKEAHLFDEPQSKPPHTPSATSTTSSDFPKPPRAYHTRSHSYTGVGASGTVIPEVGMSMSDSTVNLIEMPTSPHRPTKRLLEGSPKKDDSKARQRTLSDIDRYTLCSNRIV